MTNENSFSPGSTPRWHYVYYFMAAVNFLTIAAALAMSHHLRGEYSAAAALNSQWSHRVLQFNTLARLATEVNAPGNDVFASGNIAAERERLESARLSLLQHFNAIEQELGLGLGIGQTFEDAGILAELDAAQSHSMRLITHAENVFTHLDADRKDDAGREMAAMDAELAETHRSIHRLGEAAERVQAQNMEIQQAKAREMRNAEIVLVLFTMFAISGALWFGRSLSTRFRQENERNQRLHTQLSNIVDSSPHGLILVNSQRVIQFASPSMETIFGYSPSELIGQTIDRLLPTTVRAGHDHMFASFVADPRPRGLGQGRDLSGIRKNGSSVFVEISLIPVHFADGFYVLATLMDVSARKAAEQTIREQVDELAAQSKALEQSRKVAEAASQTKSEFLANMSHEIRTPMTAILGYTELLLEDEEIFDVPEKRIEAIQTIQKNGEHLLGIINDILDLSKIEAGKLTVETVAYSPLSIVEEVLSLMRVRSQAKGLALDVTYQTEIPDTIQTDPIRLRQILLNLTANAIKFTEIGSVQLVVRLISGDEPKLQFDVIDTGIGLMQEQRDRLFQAFSQADNSTTRKFGGTGLGLIISKRLAEMLGGDILIVESERGVGTRFRLTISVGALDGVSMVTPDRGSNLVPAKALKKKASQQSKIQLSGCRILLAEDSPDNQRLVTFILKKAGADVTVCQNGQLAVDAALHAVETGEPFDVILMDMQMPVLDGYGATTLLRTKSYQGCVIALTAHALNSEREKCLSIGCDDYATKPIDRDKLIAQIASYANGGTPKQSTETIAKVTT